MKAVQALGILLLYALTHFIFDAQIDALGEYASYIGEAILIAGAFAIYRTRLKLLPRPVPRALIAQAPAALVLGAATYWGALKLSLPIPFDMASAKLVFLLLVVGPVLEECLFRFALWHPLEELGQGAQWIAVCGTAALFSFGHFTAYFQVPAELKNFVLYQTAYTLVLGYWWGCVYGRTRAIGATIGLHVFYNAGFYLGFKVWAGGGA